MNKLEKIITVAKELAASYIKGEGVDENKIRAKFEEKDAVEIIEKIKNEKSKGEDDVLFTLLNDSKQKDWEILKTKLKPKSKLRFLKTVMRVAAIFLGVLGLAYYSLQEGFFNDDNSSLIIKEEVVTLRFDNGNVEVVSLAGERKIVDANGKIIGVKKGNELNYAPSEGSVEELSYNELTVPYGQTFELGLSDGTKVKLNSGTIIKYPVKFLKGQARNVFLKSGEAYFDVVKDDEHPFVVNAKNLNVRVLGTQFNVSAYPEDSGVNTVLVEGSVSLYAKDSAYIAKNTSVLKPGYKASWKSVNQKIKQEKVDTFIYTAWVKGKMVFDHMPFKHIIKKLERHYNVSIINSNIALGEETFTATFDVEDIEQVLNSFSKNYPIEYSFKNNKILIK